MNAFALRIAVFLTLSTASPLAAQGYPGIYADTIRDSNLHDNQFETQRMDRGKHEREIIDISSRPLSLAERQAAWSRNKTEYRRRMLRDGPAAADRWLDQQARRDARQSPTPGTSRKSMKGCKKVRYVTRPTPGFGGGPMTMSRVAVCAD